MSYGAILQNANALITLDWRMPAARRGMITTTFG